MNKYMGHPTQASGIEEHRLVGGKGDGMRLFEVRNGKGIEFTISADRCGDISRLSYKGINLGFFAPCGYVAPQYYDNKGANFLKSFTAGFLTTCGLTAVGSPCTDNGEELPLHGTISHIPAENVIVDSEKLKITLTMRDASLFSHHLILTRTYECIDNEIILTDKVKNIGTKTSEYMILYHFNMGYPLLCENSKINICSNHVTPRNEHSKKGLDNRLIVESPQNGFEEQCYYYDMNKGEASLYNPDLRVGVKFCYNTEELPCFTQWKMMGEYEYVMGLEPGNCYPDGRDVMRERRMLKFIAPSEEITQTIKIGFID